MSDRIKKDIDYSEELWASRCYLLGQLEYAQEENRRIWEERCRLSDALEEKRNALEAERNASARVLLKRIVKKVIGKIVRIVKK